MQRQVIPWTASAAAWKVCVLCMLVVGVGGCGPQQLIVEDKRPRPVAVTALRKTPAPDAALIAASAGSWKTEDIGFEVSGRIEFVVEQNTSIEGRIDDGAGKIIVEGTPIARLEAERFRLQVDRAQADVRRAEQSLSAAETELEQTIPAQIAAAMATRKLAETDFGRSEQLLSQNAVARADYDREKASLDSAVARVKELEAVEQSKKAELESLKNAVLQAKQNLRDAQRNLEDCTLYSSFRGQVAHVSVVPGSVVSAGQSIVRLQMMDPIKIEMEVSAQQSRRLRRSELYPVYITTPDGGTEIQQGIIHQIDAIADPLTRTYTVTLLTLNKKLSESIEPSVATTPNIWRLDLPFLPGASEGRLFVEEKAILHDEDGAYLWQITNATTQSGARTDPFCEVRKIRITPGQFKAPYVDSWVFQEVSVDDEAFDPHLNLVIGELIVPEGTPEKWNGDRVYLDSGSRWLLRPGDLVKVDLSAKEESEGYYIPLSAVNRRQEQTAIFVLEEADGHSVARRIPIQIVMTDQKNASSSYCLIEAADKEVSLEGLLCITKGTHYVTDGEKVNPIVSGGAVE